MNAIRRGALARFASSTISSASRARESLTSVHALHLERKCDVLLDGEVRKEGVVLKQRTDRSKRRCQLRANLCPHEYGQGSCLRVGEKDLNDHLVPAHDECEHRTRDHTGCDEGQGDSTKPRPRAGAETRGCAIEHRVELYERRRHRHHRVKSRDSLPRNDRSARAFSAAINDSSRDTADHDHTCRASERGLDDPR